MQLILGIWQESRATAHCKVSAYTRQQHRKTWSGA